MKNAINPKKLLHSKWTAMAPQNKEKHFMIVAMEFNEDGGVIHCTMQAVINKREFSIDWRSLKNQQQWLHGWK